MSAYFDIYQSPPQKDGRISIHPRLVEPGHIKNEQLLDDEERSSTLTRTDLRAALDAVSRHLAVQLGRGGSIHLDGIGTFSVVPHFKEPKYEGDKVSGRDVAFRRIRFTPERRLKALVENALRFERRNGRHSDSCDEEKAKALLREYFSTHGTISKREFQTLTHTCEHRARILLGALMEEGFISRRRIGTAYIYSLNG